MWKGVSWHTSVELHHGIGIPIYGGSLQGATSLRWHLLIQYVACWHWHMVPGGNPRGAAHPGSCVLGKLKETVVSINEKSITKLEKHRLLETVLPAFGKLCGLERT